MKRWILALLVMLAASPGVSSPRVTPPNGTKPYAVTVTFEASDTTDSEAIPVSGFCTVRYQQSSGDDASLYSVPTADTATGSGTLIKSFTASTTSPTTFTAGTRWVKAVATDATAGGSVMTIECAPQTAGGSTSGAACSNGSTQGGGYDSTTGLFDWTCGNYNWSASYGGIDVNGVSDFESPTTAGGNSWMLHCTGDGTASNGTSAEGSICLEDGEEIKMYAMADIMLAHDFTRPGGTIFLPDGLYHDRYCGQSEAASANGCPVLRRSPGHQTRKISISRGIKLVASGMDPDGPHVNGRTGAWLISDHGGDSDNDGVIYDNVTDPGGYAGFQPGHWSFRVGLGGGSNTDRICVTNGSTGCVTEDSAVRDQAYEPFNAIGRSSSMIIESFNTSAGATPYVCIENRPATLGVCAADPRVQCTSDTDCTDVGGSCVGPADAIETLLEANADSETNGSQASGGLYMSINTFAQSDFGTDDIETGHAQAAIAMISNVHSTTCASGNGRIVGLGDMQDARSFYATTNAKYNYALWNPVQFPSYDQTTQNNRVMILTPDLLFNVGGGYYGVNIMPGSWKDRRSTTAAADCTNNWLTTYEAACDDVELMALGAGIGGGIYDSSVWYGGGSGGFSYSKIDGDIAGFASEAKRNWFMRGYGLQTDASGWTFEDNIWQDVNAASHGASTSGTNIIALAFAPGFRMYRDRFWNVNGDSLFYFQGATGSVIRDIEVNGGRFGYSILNIRGARRAVVDGITGHGIRTASPIIIDPTTTHDVFDVHVSNVYLDNVAMNASTMAQAKAMVWATDASSGGGVVTGPVVIENYSMSVHGDDSYCALFLDGGTGDESDAANGSGRAVDDWRHFLTFKNFDLERISDGSVGGTFQATCLSDESPTAATSNGPEDGLSEFYAAEGGMPRWENIYVNGVQYPDNPLNSQTAASAGDCQSLPHGTTVLVHDATAASTCTDAGADGVLDGGGTAPNEVTVRCKCDPAGDAGDGAWSAF